MKKKEYKVQVYLDLEGALESAGEKSAKWSNY